MKVRWTNDSLRLRITPRELHALGHGEGTSARLELPGGRWEVVLRPRAAEMGVTMDRHAVIVTLTADDLERLGDPSTEGVYSRAGAVRLMIEKDFPCAHPHPEEAGEPETEHFAPPPGFISRRTRGA